MGSIWWLIHSTGSVKRATETQLASSFNSIDIQSLEGENSLLFRCFVGTSPTSKAFRCGVGATVLGRFPVQWISFRCQPNEEKEESNFSSMEQGPKGAAVALVPITADWLTKANLKKTQTIIHVLTLSSGKLGAGDDEWCNVDTADRWIFGACR